MLEEESLEATSEIRNKGRRRDMLGRLFQVRAPATRCVPGVTSKLTPTFFRRCFHNH